MKEDDPHNGPDGLEKAERIAYLIARSIREELTPDERRELDAWVGESDDNVLLYEKLTDENAVAEMSMKTKNFNPEASMAKAKQKIVFAKEKKSRMASTAPWIAAASLVGFGFLLLFIYRNSHTAVEAPAAATAHDAPPGRSRAVLELADGSAIVLDTAAIGKITGIKLEISKTDSGAISYNRSAGQSKGEAGFNTLTVPRGGQFRVKLPDGTEVWLNAASSLRYPISFSAGTREVELSGEGYFEVTKDPSRPFRVRTPKAAIEVLGTHFDISAYPDDDVIRTTLLEGSVRVSTEKANMILQPSEQAVSDRDGKINISKDIDIEGAVAWKNGLFSFRKEEIGSVMKKLGRWYDLEVDYQDNVSNHFNGQIDRRETASKVLRLLEATGDVHFKIEGKKIIVNR